ncbi:RlmE family RNA methyltransferase [Corallococcus sp. AB011P]|uniref:SAM-dependent methyltransferase n=1 Tax=unclassified Corallococcus TaxID=2685029 RepID=UPI000EA3808A|nr:MULTISPECIES: RlmE family RNA methyltransferase [unclassified Corallococcus]RKG54930.1 RlmE family RNA methyltransferase [Corallococcus sp. AB011P]RKH85255.1 RlmE family RNA methyltransferase [Corallococcus sp. AB045]
MLGTASDMGKPYRPKDHYFQKAKQEGLRARSAFKVDEILKRFPSSVKKGAAVLDLGAAPGGFLQILADAVGMHGRVIGVDISAIRPFSQKWVTTAVLDVLADDFDAKLAALYDGPYDAVISDMAPKTSGIKGTDEARSLRLAGKALEVAATRGRPGGTFVAKVFMGGDFEAFRDEVRQHFEEVKIVRPEATRGASMEVYVVGLRRRAPAPSAT